MLEYFYLNKLNVNLAWYRKFLLLHILSFLFPTYIFFFFRNVWECSPFNNFVMIFIILPVLPILETLSIKDMIWMISFWLDIIPHSHCLVWEISDSFYFLSQIWDHWISILFQPIFNFCLLCPKINFASQ